jgi:flagellar basal-body rod modification protein FlgD
LAAQLRQQNPLEPLDSKDFMAQTAQFYTLEQLQQLNSAFTQSRELGALSQASGLIGKAVTAVDANNQRIDGIVEEVTLQNGQPLLLVDGIAISLDDIVVIRQAAGSGQLADDETPVDDGPVDSVGAADN